MFFVAIAVDLNRITEKSTEIMKIGLGSCTRREELVPRPRASVQQLLEL